MFVKITKGNEKRFAYIYRQKKTKEAAGTLFIKLMMKRKKEKTDFIFLLPSIKEKNLQMGKCKIKELKCKIDEGVENFFLKCGKNVVVQLSKLKVMTWEALQK